MFLLIYSRNHPLSLVCVCVCVCVYTTSMFHVSNVITMSIFSVSMLREFFYAC